jgi:hypothetical protein
LKNIRGFMGLMGYYHKIVNNYGQITTPLTKILKNEAFSLTQEATKDFGKLKEAMCPTPVLATRDFTKTFIVECNALGHGICAVVLQEGGPLAFECSQLKGNNLFKPIYEKDMLVILHAVKKQCHYLI